MLSALVIITLAFAPAALAQADEASGQTQVPNYAQGSNPEPLSDEMRDAVENMKKRMAKGRKQNQEQGRKALLDARQTMADALRGENGRLKKLADKLDRSLGKEPTKGHLMVFISHSMSDNFIRSYLQEAAWSGASVYVRGIPPGMSIKDYMTQKLRPLIQKRPGAGVKINPKLFGLYGIEVAPTIVWDPGRRNRCTDEKTVPAKDDQGGMQQIDRCVGTDDTFWQISGGVTMDYALRAFRDQGAKGAAKRLAILRENLKPGSDSNQKQTAYSGDWGDAKMPRSQPEGLGGVEDRKFLSPPSEVLSDTSTVIGKDDSDDAE